MVNVKETSKSFDNGFLALWVMVSTILSPIAIFAGLASTYIVAPWNTGAIDPEAIPDPLSLLIARSIIFALVAGGILETPRWLMLRRFSSFPFWIPATVFSLAIGMFIIYYQDLSLNNNRLETSCLTDLPTVFIHLWPLALPGIAQSIVFAKNNNKWLLWVFAGSTSYLFPLSGFMACTGYGFFLGSFITAVITGLVLQITMDNDGN